MICVPRFFREFSASVSRFFETEDAMIRIGCTVCDAAEDEIPDLTQATADGWTHIEEVQSYEEACTEVDTNDQTRSVFDWQTHPGTCPRCSEVDR